MVRFSIRTKLIIILSIILLFGFLSTNIINYNVSRNLVRAGIIGNSLPLARDNIYSEIQRDLMRPIFVSSLMANDTFLKDWVIDGEKDPAQIIKYLEEVRAKYDFFASFFVSDKTKKYYHFKGLHKIISPEDAHDSWYYEFKDLDVEYDLDVDTNEAEQNHLTIFINHRLKDYNGNFIGVVGVGLNFDMVDKLLTSYKKKYDRDVYMVSSDGLIQVHTNRDFILKTNIFKQEGIQDFAGQILSSYDDPSFFEYVANGQQILLTCRYVRELDWYLLVEQNQSHAMSSVKTTFVRNLIFSLLITFATIFITILVINHFQKQLEVMATRDKLTHAYNRAEFERRFTYLEGMMKREMVKLSMIMIDIDHFKAINDTRGHVYGDRILKTLAEKALGVIRQNDMLARWGGDEFVIMILGDISHAEAIAGRLFAVLSQMGDDPGDPESDPMSITISCGIARYQNGDTLDSLVNRADNALYKAKEMGRNRFVIEDGI